MRKQRLIQTRIWLHLSILMTTCLYLLFIDTASIRCNLFYLLLFCLLSKTTLVVILKHTYVKQQIFEIKKYDFAQIRF